jgi:hypothetical protein
MKTHTTPKSIALLTALLLAVPFMAVGAEATNTTEEAQSEFPAGSIKLVLQLPKVLELYAEITGAQLDTNQIARAFPVVISVENKKDITRAEAIKLFDKAFHDQAGLVVTHPDAKHVVFRMRTPRDKWDEK